MATEAIGDEASHHRVREQRRRDLVPLLIPFAHWQFAACVAREVGASVIPWFGDVLHDQLQRHLLGRAPRDRAATGRYVVSQVDYTVDEATEPVRLRTLNEPRHPTPLAVAGQDALRYVASLLVECVREGHRSSPQLRGVPRSEHFVGGAPDSVC